MLQMMSGLLGIEFMWGFSFSILKVLGLVA
jgi:hypothetical protein